MEERADGSVAPERAHAPPGADGLAVEVHRPRSGVLLLQVRGGLAAHSGPVLERHLADLLDAAGRGRRVLVDLAGVTTVTAAGLDVLLGLQERLAAVGARLELLAPSAPVLLLLHRAATE
jgi:anti-anti-sigma factor